MAGGGASTKSSSGSRLRKRVAAESSPDASSASPVLKRAKDGSAFAKCEDCHKDVPVALISFHSCSLDAKIKMNLDTTVVEKTPTEPKKKPSAQKKKAKSGEPKAKKEKKAKNPNAAKKPPTAFFLFMDDFRKSFKEANPDNKKVSLVAKEGGVKWKSMTDEEKKTYTDRAAELKAQYVKTMEGGGAINEDEGGASSEKEVDNENEVDDAEEANDEKLIEADEEVEDEKLIEADEEVEDEKVVEANEEVEDEKVVEANEDKKVVEEVKDEETE